MQKRRFLKMLAALTALVLFSGCLGAFAEAADDWMNVLLLGCDSYTTNDRQRTDSMIILSVNMQTNEVKLASLMRDIWISVPGSSSHRKLTELCAVGGPELTVRAVNENLGMNIEKYMLVSMAGIAEIIDLVGGVEIDVTEAERKALNKGLFDLSSLSGMEKLEASGEKVHLNGNQATAFARIRKIDSDYVRVSRQRIVLLAMAEKFEANVTPVTLLSIITTLLNYVETNMSLTDITICANAGLQADLENIQQLRIPIDGSYESGTYSGTWSIRPNFSKNAQALHDFIYAGSN